MNPIRSKIEFGLLLALVLVNLPAAVTGDLADPALLRPEKLPDAWTRAATYLDMRYDQGETGSVLLLPGIESAAYRWGYPVDPILPGLSKKPLLTRDWLPLGSPAVMDLLYALDDSVQNGTADPESIAPVARMLGADTVMFVSSHQYERFGTIRPSRAFDLFDPPPAGLTFLAQFGDSRENRFENEPWSEESAVFPPRHLSEITLFAVEDVSSPARLHARTVLASTDGTGLVDLAAMGQLNGGELSISEASLDDDELDIVLGSSPGIVVTDSNRRRAHHWRGSQEVWGATEPEVGVLTRLDDFDSRLPIHPEQTADSETLVESAPVEATATAYGAELRYYPEYRPRMAVDGDPDTAWRIGTDRSAVGHVLTLDSDEPISLVRLVQPQDRNAVQWITSVSIRADDDPWMTVELSDVSRRPIGQVVRLPRATRHIDIRIDELNDENLRLSSLGVGFAEVLDTGATPEVVALPSRSTDSVHGRNASVTYSLNRLRSDPFDRWRDDPETSLIRRLPAALKSTTRLEVEARLSSRAADELIAAQLRWTGGVASTRMHGSARWWGQAAFDGDSSTRWMGPIETDTRASAPGSFIVPVSQPVEWLEIEQSSDPDTSPIREITVTSYDGTRTLQRRSIDIPLPSPLGLSRVDLTGTLSTSVPYDRISFEITAVEPHLVTDSFTGRSVPAPVSIVEFRSNAWRNRPLPSHFDTGCRDDLLFIDDEPVPLRLSGVTTSALAGEPVSVTPCDAELPAVRAGSVVRTSAGLRSAWNIDRVLISSSAPAPDTRPIDIASSSRRASFSADLPSRPSTLWLEAPFGFSEGWSGSLDTRSSLPSLRSAAGRTVWMIPSGAPTSLTAQWVPQRWMWVGFALSGATAVALLLTLCSRRRRGFDPLEGNHDDADTDEWETHTSSARSRFILSVSGLVIGSILVSPFWGALVAVSLLAIPAHRLTRYAIVSVSLGYGFVLAQQIRVDPQPGFGWPEAFHRAHRPMLAVIIVFVIAIHGSSTSRQSTLGSEHHSD